MKERLKKKGNGARGGEKGEMKKVQAKKWVKDERVSEKRFRKSRENK